MNKRVEKILILTSDIIMINMAFILFFIVRVKTGWFSMLITPEFVLPMLFICFYWLVIFTFSGMFRTWFAQSRFDEISTLIRTSFYGVLILFFVIFIDDYTHGVKQGNRFLIFIYWAFFLVLVAIGRLTVRSIQRQLLIKGIGRRNTLIIGTGEKAVRIHDQILSHAALGLDIVGYIAVKDSELSHEHNSVKTLATINSLSEQIDKSDVKEIVIAFEQSKEEHLINILVQAESKNIGLKIVPDLYEILSGQARTMQLYGFPLVDINPQLMSEWERFTKRTFDIIISFLLLILSSPVMLLTVIAIKIDSKGTAFFKQDRCGLNGKVFKIVKYRSMYSDAEKTTGPVWSQKGDPRITRVGKFIRKVRIDELPQMFNVLKGEMSLVGPRPERPFFVEKLAKEIPYYKRRLRVRPGITGWAQVKHKYDETVEDVKMKLQYDLFYIENMSMKTDFKILFRTIFVVLFGKGHYS